ncbi:protein phosphatase 2C domain-containing protein [Chitinophaga oryzae]|uniref:Protein phosphatase 2C domain-containing protein n=1 Tax=Chitinophaga oryzae TaxID=2725414 RepID=A0AAE6ZFM7_9BACT|nr:PP2C family serine/threonine-protein phosphatase [Chitinophaga oryzae]QJB32110.1 protein phosphatase 2C domain-containing protein [Chitinophaga oryzae]
MSKKYIRELFAAKNITIAGSKQHLFDAFVDDEQHQQIARQILENQQRLMDIWQYKNRLADIQQQPVTIPNATVGKPYQATLDFRQLNWSDVTWTAIEGLEEYGLQYDPATGGIQGVPVKSGDIRLKLQFRLAGGDASAAAHEKVLPLVINPDPRSLWKSIPSDMAGPFWKADDVAEFAPLGDRFVTVASKRGRSHANVGSFRDDDYAFRHLEPSGWSVLAVSDGAGSARLSREGSRLACTGIIDYFEQFFKTAPTADIDALFGEHAAGTGTDTQKKINRLVYDTLGKAAFAVHKKLEEFAAAQQVSIKDLHSTLIFVLLKKYAFGYVIMSFGVGDCPIGLLNKDCSAVTLMNRLDVGEFGGGTRFITMPEIFTSDKFPTRFGFKLVPDFAYLMLMTDGIYDPKFVVEANLEKLDTWKAFLADLNGNNPENVALPLGAHSPESAGRLSAWMDFWSPGNHDDRTLMIIS